MKWVRRLLPTVIGVMWLFSQSVGAVAIITETESGITASEAMQLKTPTEFDEALSVAGSASALEIGGRSAVLMDMTSGTVLYEKNPHEPLPIASVTKVMTLLLTMEAIGEGRISTDDTVTCSAEAAAMGGSQIWLEPGECMSVDDLIKAAAVVSANDACAALAEHIDGSIEGFVEHMNVRAAELGMTDTLFLDCSGLNDEAHSSAYDVALMSRELMKHPLICRYTTIWMDSLRDGKSQLVNTNKLIRFYKGATGLKTGTTSTAGHNLSATAEREGLSLVAVILGCSTTAERFGGARKLLDYGFANYSLYTPQWNTSLLIPVPVVRGVQSTVETYADAPEALLMKKGEEKRIACSVELAEDVEAPVETGQIIGRIRLTLDGEELATYPVYAKASVERLGFGASFSRLLRALCA